MLLNYAIVCVAPLAQIILLLYTKNKVSCKFSCTAVADKNAFDDTLSRDELANFKKKPGNKILAYPV